MPSSFILKTAALPPVERLVRRSFLFRPLVRRFIAGDTLEEALGHSESLCDRNLQVSLDYLGENTQSEAEALAAKSTYSQMLDRIAESRHREKINISIKLTQCGLDQGEAFAESNFREVLRRAQEKDNFVRVDMEGSEYTARTIEMLTRVWADHKNTGTVLQSYLYRTTEDVDQMIELGMRTRLVKGAYLEPSSVAFPEKSKVDEAYVEQAKRLLARGHYPAIATHDEAIIRELKQFVADEKIDPSRFEWQMLYGIRRDLQDGLRAEGFNVRVYVPFGDAWYPYFSRRLAERPANAFFILKSLFRK
ncbi:MAG TPA: proline dehydrogenase family protein [Fimbriimonadaceae bacterium]|nr:proline dehydrogenase family protein [Fimbriimonadaceae bacterium]HRJ33207.1 proline dehydrogenase family protein [Fimbriimonadaceae bacterium]